MQICVWTPRKEQRKKSLFHDVRSGKHVLEERVKN